MAASRSATTRAGRRLLLLPAPASGKTATFDSLVEQVTAVAAEVLSRDVRIVDNLTALMGRPCAVVECDASASEFSQLCRQLAADDWMAVNADEIVTLPAAPVSQPAARRGHPQSSPPLETPDDDSLAR